MILYKRISFLKSINSPLEQKDSGAWGLWLGQAGRKQSLGWGEAVRLGIALLTQNSWREEWGPVPGRGMSLNTVMAWSLFLGWLADPLGCLKGKLPRWWKRGPSPLGKTRQLESGQSRVETHGSQPFKSGVSATSNLREQEASWFVNLHS